MKKLRNLILIMVCMALTVTTIPHTEYNPISPHDHHEPDEKK